MSLYENYCRRLEELYPSVSRTAPVRELLSPNLISDYILHLPPRAFTEAQAAVSAFFALRSSTSYQTRVADFTDITVDASVRADAANRSALMSYDFHWTGTDLKLIEINTNASSSLLVDLLYREQRIENPYGFDFRSEILRTFKNEHSVWATAARVSRDLKIIAIVDDKPAQQRMYIEFLMYKDLFDSAGYTCVIADPSELRIDGTRLLGPGGIAIDLVYNRHTDFYLESASNAVLREAYLQDYACFSPHPREYALLADKERLLELSQPDALATSGLSPEQIAAIDRVLLKSFDGASMPPEELWAKRKKLFFKPKRSFGGKAVYRGSTISRRPFENMLKGEVVAQEYAPPSEVDVKLEGGSVEAFKYDLRFYVYEDRIQIVGARLYQGQTTNVKVLGGGLAPLQPDAGL